MILFKHPDLNIFLGPPGTGKTTSLLNVMETELARGVKPNKIGFVSFTKKATVEAKERASEKFGLDPNKLPYFRTNHSLAFMSLGLDRSKVMQTKDYQEVGRACSVDITGNNVSVDEGLPAPGSLLGDRLLFCDHLSRNRCVSLYSQWRALGDDEIDWDMQRRFSEALTGYKTSRGLIDYTDMLELATERGYFPDLDVIIIDEAQDLSTLQWRLMYVIARKTGRVYIAGDDDQAIYRWAGADVDQFISLKGRVTVLDHSYRLPRSVYNVAQGILQKIAHRRPKAFNPRDSEGCVRFETDIYGLDMSQGTWLILARNNYLLESVESYLRSQGLFYMTKRHDPARSETIHAIKAWETLRRGKSITGVDARIVYRYISTGRGIKRGYKELKDVKDDSVVSLTGLKNKHGLLVDSIWHDALDRIDRRDRDYYTAVLKRGEKITTTPRITVSTIHGAKGGQAQNVVLLTDISTKTMEELKKNPDDEHRVFYVGVTRAEENLYVVQPRGLAYAI